MNEQGPNSQAGSIGTKPNVCRILGILKGIELGMPKVSPLSGGAPLGFTFGVVCVVLAVLLPAAPPPPLLEGLLPELHRPINTQNSWAEPANSAHKIGSPPQKFVCHMSPSLNGSKPSGSIAFSGLLFTYAYRLRDWGLVRSMLPM